MNEQNNLSQYAAVDSPFQFEIYVMNYLIALAQQPIYGGEHPLNIELHLMPNEAFLLLRDPREIEKLQKLLNCDDANEIFARLRDRLDDWDGVRVAESFEAADLFESDSETFLFSTGAHQIASRYLKCQPGEVLSTLFDAGRIYKDLKSVSGGIYLANNDVGKLLQYLKAEPNLRQKIKSNLDLMDWWEVLENWIKPATRSELVYTLSAESDHTISKAFVLRELFRKIKMLLGVWAPLGKKYAKYIESTRLGTALPEGTSKFWQTLREFSKENNDALTLDGISEENIARNSHEASAKEALRIAENYMQTYVQPIQQELGRVDMLGMIALRHRFQGIIDELLSSALHYASLDNDVQHPLSYVQDAIRYYCHGEYRIALSDLLNVTFLSIEQMGLEYRVTSPDLLVTNETPLALFSSEDNGVWPLGILKRGNTPPRTVKNDELIIALQVENRSIEILCLNRLEKPQIDHLKANFPKTVADLAYDGSALIERIVKTPLKVSTEREKLNEALKDQIDLLVPSLVLSGTTFSLGHLISAIDVFNKTPNPLWSDSNLTRTCTMDELVSEITSAYKAESMRVTRVNGV